MSIRLTPCPRGEQPSILAEAELTKDMVQTLHDYFEAYAVDGVVRVEVSTKGLWLPNPITGGRQFLGLARLPNGGRGDA